MSATPSGFWHARLRRHTQLNDLLRIDYATERQITRLGAPKASKNGQVRQRASWWQTIESFPSLPHAALGFDHIKTIAALLAAGASLFSLRQVDLVMQDGRLMEAAASREAAGYSGLPN